MKIHALTAGRGAGNLSPASDEAPAKAGKTATSGHATGSPLKVQSSGYQLPHYPFQPLPPPNGKAPYRYDLSQLLTAAAVKQIEQSGTLVFHCIGDTGDARGQQMDFVAAMMTADYHASADAATPAFCYHLGDVVYFAGDIDDYGACYYETYAEYPGPIVAIAGNHDCQPDDPQDGPVDPTKKPLDGWVQNFMAKDPAKLGSLKTSSSRTQMDLPNVYWTFTTPFATIIGLFSNVSETEAEIHPDQIAWFKGELTAAATDKALIVAIHHPPFSGDEEHSGSVTAEEVLFESFTATGRYPHLVLSGHVHNYQRFTTKETGKHGAFEVSCVVCGNGGYTRLGKLNRIKGKFPVAPLDLTSSLTLENYDQANFGFLRFEVTAKQITGIYSSAPYQVGATPAAKVEDRFTIDLATRTVKPG